MKATQCVSCTKAIEGSDVYLRPGDGSCVCVRCYLRADHSSLQPPEPGGAGSWPTGDSSGSEQLAAAFLVDAVISIITD